MEHKAGKRNRGRKRRRRGYHGGGHRTNKFVPNGTHFCPAHGNQLAYTVTKYGLRYHCTAEGCTVVLWNGSTSTPADYDTRQARHECHTLFDPLWKTGRMSRNEAYKWLNRVVGEALNVPEVHFGRMNLEQCRAALAVLKTIDKGDL